MTEKKPEPFFADLPLIGTEAESNDEVAPEPTKKFSNRKEKTMFKKTRIQLNDLPKNQQRIGDRQVTEAVLKMVSGGAMSEGGTSSNTADTDA